MAARERQGRKEGIRVPYINNVSSGVCLGISKPDKIEIEETRDFVDCETGEPLNSYKACAFGNMPVIGRMYRCEKQWLLRRGFETLGVYKTEEEARKAYDKIISELAIDNTVISI